MLLPSSIPTPAGPRPLRWTCAEFHRFGDMGLFEGRQAMLIDGVILEQGPMNPETKEDATLFEVAPLLGEGMKVRDVIKRLEADGWYRIRSKGGQFKHDTKKGRVTVAGKLNVDVPIKTLKSIWNQAQLPEED